MSIFSRIRVIAAVLVVAISAACGPAFAQTSGSGESAAAEPSARSAGATKSDDRARPRSAFARPATPSAEPPPASDGMVGRAWTWLLQTQQSFHRKLATGVRHIKSEGTLASVFFLSMIGFVYGVLHAAGPGHGKAVISSYVLANERTVRRGIALSFLAAFFQAISAIVLVGILAIVLNAAGMRIKAISDHLETVSYALVAALGLWLIYRQIRPWLRSLNGAAGVGAEHNHHAGHGSSHDQSHQQSRGHEHGHGHAHGHRHAHLHQHAAGEVCATCGHSHMPDARQMSDRWSWREALALALSVGIRPCTGAILVLIFAVTQGIFWAGVAATFAMSLGTALTVSVLAALAVGSRELALRYAGDRSHWAGRIELAAGLGGAGLVFLLGASLFIASLGAARPF